MLAELNRRIDMVIVHAWESLSETFEARASEWMLGAVMVSLSIVTMLNDTLFGAPEFDSLSRLLSQDSWALIFLVMGFVRVLTLIINGAYWRTPHLRTALAFFSCFVWFQLALGFASSFGFGVAIFPWLFLLDAFNVLRAGREAGIAQYLKKSRRAKNVPKRVEP